MAVRFISIPLVHKVRDHGNHLGDIVGCARFVRGSQNTKRIHIVVVPLDRLGCDIADIAPAFRSARVYLVIHIREIAHVGDVIRAVNLAQQAKQNVKHQ